MTNKIAMFLIFDTFERHHILIKIEKYWQTLATVDGALLK